MSASDLLITRYKIAKMYTEHTATTSFHLIQFVCPSMHLSLSLSLSLSLYLSDIHVSTCRCKTLLASEPRIFSFVCNRLSAACFYSVPGQLDGGVKVKR